jgi:hypothetical protein
MKEVRFKEYHDHLGENKYLVLRWYVTYFNFTSLHSLLVVVNITTQKQEFDKGHIEVYRTLIDELLQFHQLK